MHRTSPYQSLKRQSLVIAVLFIALALIGMQFFAASIVFVILAPCLIVALSWRLYRALHRQVDIQQLKEFRQLEALQGLYSTLDIRYPLPRTRHRAGSPDFLHLLASEILRSQPEVIVEMGSGTSTLIAAYCLKKLGHGKIISLDHLEEFAGISASTIERHGLDGYAEVVYAPLITYDLDGESYQWYDAAALKNYARIDLLIVDGPPRNISSRARYPAIPVLRDKLHKDTVVLLDDAARPGESEIVELWKRRYGMNYRLQPMEKGAIVGNFDEAN